MADESTEPMAGPEPGVLRAEARVARSTAELCRQVADGIDRRRLALAERIEPARVAHRPDIWSSAAATRSRAHLNRQVAPGLWFLAHDLGLTARRLRDEAATLESRARALSMDADEIETLMAPIPSEG